MGRNETEALGERLGVFGWFEYIIFFSMLFMSAGIGIFHALKRKSATVDEYMLGGRNMPILPVAMSLVASFVSGITLLGIPSETYLYGTQLYGICLAIIICFVFLNLFYLPVVYDLQFKSFYEYLERRFDNRVRRITSLVFALSLLTYIPVVIYVPALAFNQVTGMSMGVLAPIICTVCIFYTSIGGLKGVVWSDFLQSLFTIFSMVVVLILGFASVGGVARVIEINQRGERLELFNMDPDPFLRNTFWTTAIGSVPHWLKVLSCHPSSVQRYISLPTYRQAQVVTVFMTLGIVGLKTISTVTGMVIYAKYHDCDPVHTKKIQRPAQILPFYILDVAKDWPGLAGLFLSGVVSTALSTMSTGLNTLAGTLYEDFLKGVLPWKQTDRAANLTMKLTVVVLGVCTTLLVFVVERMGTVMQVAISLHGVTTGVQLFVFTLGMFVPWANANGALAGTVVGVLSTAWMMTGAQLYKASGEIYYGTKLLSVEGCPDNSTLHLNQTLFGHGGLGTVVRHAESVPYFFRVSYLHYATVGFGAALLTALLVSLATGLQDPAELDPRLVVPQIRRFLRTRRSEHLPATNGRYKEVPLADLARPTG